jgi:hypothetical protein
MPSFSLFYNAKNMLIEVYVSVLFPFIEDRKLLGDSMMILNLIVIGKLDSTHMLVQK